jgi:hypothetical protein
MADRLESDGFADVGYQFINIDDCWSEMQRDNKTQRLIPNKQRFSHGIKPLADYVHSLGLKLGIYGDVGPKTCAGYESFDNQCNIKRIIWKQGILPRMEMVRDILLLTLKHLPIGVSTHSNLTDVMKIRITSINFFPLWEMLSTLQVISFES